MRLEINDHYEPRLGDLVVLRRGLPLNLLQLLSMKMDDVAIVVETVNPSGGFCLVMCEEALLELSKYWIEPADPMLLLCRDEIVGFDC